MAESVPSAAGSAECGPRLGGAAPHFPRVLAVLVSMLVIGIAEVGLALQARVESVERRLDAGALGDQLRARLERELNAVLFLTAGLRSYLVASGDATEPAELRALLADGYASSKHIRNFGVARGTVIRYVYPLADNAAAVGTDYRDVPGQWPGVRRAIEQRRPQLSPLVDLLQGGEAFIYRVPVFHGDQFWGLISAVVDAQSLFNAAFTGVPGIGYEFAVADESGRLLWGHEQVLEQSDATIAHADRGWIIGVRRHMTGTFSSAVPALRVSAWALAVILGVLAYASARRILRRQVSMYYDELTGLPGRRLLLERIAESLGRARVRRNARCGVVYCDIDDFHSIKERLGERASEAVLREAARRLCEAVGDWGRPARWGNDEFLVLCAGEQPSQEQVERIVSAVEGTVIQRGARIQLGVSIGVAHAPVDGENSRDLIECAEQRMREGRAKRAGRLRPLPV